MRLSYVLQKLPIAMWARQANLKASFKRVRTVQRVALRGSKTGVRDDAAAFAFVGAVFHAGREDDVFFDQNAADVVSSKLQTNLADFDSRREPARLNVVDVVEVQAADRQRFQIIDCSGFLNFFSKRGIFR